MKQVLQYPRRNGLVLEECPHPVCKEGGLLVKNRFSLISPGTERAIIDLATKSLAGKARSRPDLVKQVLDKIKTEGLMNTLNKVRARLNVPIPLGYSSSGVVTEVGSGVADYGVGDRVACAGFGYASHADEIFVPKNLAVPLPQNLTFEEGAFVTLGAIALWGVRQAGVTLGERVAVIGLGLLGQLTVQILRASGCQVIGVDIDQTRLDETARFGAELLVNSSDDNAERSIWHFTEGNGADAILITAATKSSQPVEFAATIARDRARVVMVGDVTMNLPRKPFYDKELSLSLSRSYGPGRYDSTYEEQGHDYPIGYVRWTENRNMRAFLDLVASGRIDVKSLVSDTVDITAAATAFERIEAEKVLGILLKYQTEAEPTTIPTSVAPSRSTRTADGKLLASFIGAGNFATGVLLPAVQKHPDISLHALHSATPNKAVAMASQFGFSSTAGSTEEILRDPDTDLVFIATPHNLHAQQVIDALKAGKSVFVEKPLCLTMAELGEIRYAQSQSGAPLMVGFNRRFAPAIAAIMTEIGESPMPMIVDYTINAGFIPKSSWIQDDKIGGGRIRGEVCHFIDLITWITSSQVERVNTVGVTGSKGGYLTSDNITMQCQLTNGSIASITYTAMGDKSYPKESMTIFSNGRVITMSDFRTATLTADGKSKTLYSGAQEKGFGGEIAHLAQIVRSGQTASELESYFHSTAATLAALQSLKTGEPVQVA